MVRVIKKLDFRLDPNAHLLSFAVKAAAWFGERHCVSNTILIVWEALNSHSFSLILGGLVSSPSDEGRLSFLFLVAILLSLWGTSLSTRARVGARLTALSCGNWWASTRGY
jgi:hypothetical protein